MDITKTTIEHYQQFLDEFTDIIFTISLDGSITSITREFEEITGWKREEWIGKKFLDIVHPEDVSIVIEGFKSIIAGESPPAYSARVKTKKGSYLTLEAKGTPQIMNGEIVGYLGIARDITKRIKMEEILRSSELQYRMVIDSINDPINVINQDQEIVLVNSAFRTWLELLKIDIKGLFGRTILEAFPFLNRKVIEEYDSILNSGQPLETEEETMINGELIYTQTKKLPIYDTEKEKVVQVLTIVRDITESKRIEQELRDNQEQLQSFMDAATDSFSLWDSDLRLVDINQTGITTFLKNVDKKEIIGKHIEEFHVDPQYFKIYKEVMRTGNSFYSETTPPPQFYGDIVISQKVFRVGNGLGIIARDITGRSKMEQELRENQERLQSFMDAATDSFSLWDSDLRLVDVNQMGIKTFLGDVSKKEIIGKHIREFHAGTKDIEDYNKVLKTGKSYFSDRIAPHRIYGDIIVSQKVFKVGDGLGIITTDITERSKMEQEIRENEEKFRSIFERAPIGMAIINLNFQFNKVNTVFCNMMEYSEDELGQLTLPDITHKGYIDRDQEFSKKLLNEELTTYQIEKRIIKKAGDTFWARTTISLLKDENGSPNFYLAMIEDISALKQKEDEVKKQLLKFKIQDGNIYLVKEHPPKLSQTVLQDLIKVGYKGTVVSRTPERVYQVQIDEKIDYIHLSSKNNIEKLLNEMEKAPPKSVFLFDRLEYIFLTEGFETAVKIIYQLSEVAYLNNLVILLSLDDSTLSEREVAVIEKETLSIEPRFMAKVSEEFLEILRYIFQQNNLGNKPSYSEVGEQLRVSRPTLRKRIKHLLATGYLVERKIGKTKSLELSRKGVSIFLTDV